MRFVVACLLAGLTWALPAAAEDGVRDLNSIIRSLAPLEYLPEHSGKPRVDLDVRFQVNSATLTRQARRQLDELGGALKSERLAGQRFRIVGHTDASGGAAYNKRLSQQRAKAVKAYLVARHRIDAASLESIGMGEEQLKNPLRPKAGLNRRVEVLALGPLPGDKAKAKKSGERKIKW